MFLPYLPDVCKYMFILYLVPVTCLKQKTGRVVECSKTPVSPILTGKEVHW